MMESKSTDCDQLAAVIKQVAQAAINIVIIAFVFFIIRISVSENHAVKSETCIGKNLPDLETGNVVEAFVTI
jgi:hypothetical protein